MKIRTFLCICFCFTIAYGNAQPVNDMCENAVTINYGDTMYGSTVSATSDGYTFLCMWDTCPNTWYSFTAETGITTIATCGDSTNYDSLIGLLTGTCDSLVCHDSNDDGCFNNASSLSWLTEEGEEYLVSIGGYSCDVGNYQLQLSHTACDSSGEFLAHPLEYTTTEWDTSFFAVETIGNGTLTWKFSCDSGVTWMNPSGIEPPQQIHTLGEHAEELVITHTPPWMDSCLVRCHMINNCGQTIAISDPAMIVVSDSVSVPESVAFRASREYILYPNPADDKLIIETSYHDVGINIIDYKGVSVGIPNTYNKERILYDTSLLVSGLYVVQIVDHEGIVAVQKFIVMH